MQSSRVSALGNANLKIWKILKMKLLNNKFIKFHFMNMIFNIIANKNQFNFIFIYEFQFPFTSTDRFLQYAKKWTFLLLYYHCHPGPSLPQTPLFIVNNVIPVIKYFIVNQYKCFSLYLHV